MIVGAHSILYSRKPEADRAFLRDVLELPNVDVGGGWLIFGLPPAEVAVHPSEENDVHEFFLMCDDAEAFAAAMKARGVSCSSVRSLGWGYLTNLSLPGGGKLGVYQPLHARPKPVGPAVGAKKGARLAARKPARKLAAAAPRKKARKPGPSR